MTQHLKCEVSVRGKMKLLSAIAVLFIVAPVCLEPYTADAAGKYDGTVPFLCVPTAVSECVAEGECRPGTAESENLPNSFKIDLKAKTVRAEDEGRLSPIKRMDRGDGEIILYGSEAGRSWVLMIQEKTGKISAAVTGDGESFVIFGICVAP
jgi:hypothetical protein